MTMMMTTSNRPTHSWAGHSWWAIVLAVAITAGGVGCGDDSSDGGDGDADADADADGDADADADADGDGDADYHPDIDPARFTSTVDNPFFPLVPGTVFRYTEASEDTVTDVEVTVTADTREVMGVTCVVVYDVNSEDGEVIEETYDWYAQDDDGNVWYFGEATTEYDGDQTSTAGSWEGGVGGAQPGIVMKADPQVGDEYRQEYLAGEAEDMARVLALGESASVPYGDFDDCVRTRDWTPLEPDKVEEKVYCRGVGQVLADLVEGGVEHQELVTVTTE